MTAIYHITHVNNLPGIIAGGGLLSDTLMREQGMTPTSIAHGHIKARRDQTAVRIPPGGVVSNYVPFYFCPRSPMLYAIHRGQVAGYPGGQSDVMHLVRDAEAMIALPLPCMHTDGNAASQPLSFHAGVSALGGLSWDVINSDQWANTLADNDRKRRKQAAFGNAFLGSRFPTSP